jgi:hypothetical protein
MYSDVLFVPRQYQTHFVARALEQALFFIHSSLFLSFFFLFLFFFFKETGGTGGIGVLNPRLWAFKAGIL